MEKNIRECASFDRSLVSCNANSADIPAGSKGLGYVSTPISINTRLVNAPTPLAKSLARLILNQYLTGD